jgi:hypothetical protein
VFDRWVAEGKVAAGGAVLEEQAHDTGQAAQGLSASGAPA